MPIVRFSSGGNVYTFPAGTLRDSDPHFRNATPQTMRLPGTDGGFDHYGSAAAPQAIGSIRLGFTLLSEDGADMDDQRDEVLAMQDWGKGTLWLQPTDTAGAERFTWARVNNIQMSQREDDLTDFQQPVTVIFQVSDPHWYVNRMEAPLWGGFHWGDGSKWGGGAPLQACSGLVTNLAAAEHKGNATALPRITVYVRAGQTCKNPRLQRLVNAHVVEEVGYTGTLSAGDVLEVNCRAASVLLNQVDAYAGLTFQTPDWLTLAPGTNTLRLLMDGESDACDAAVRWYDTYR